MIEQQLPQPLDEHPALRAYRKRTRTQLRIYAAVLVGIVVVAFVLVRLAYAHGDINHVNHASSAAPADLPLQTTASSLSFKWRTDDQAAGGNPVSNGIVVTWSAHTVNGRDARTGDVRWHYTRTDRQLCAVVQQDATTTAIYRHDGNCDEVTGFVSATGERKFWRTLMDNGSIAVSSAPNVILIVSDGNVHVIDNAGGLDRWDYEAPTGCTIGRAVGGTLGVLINLKCGDITRIVVHDLIQGDKDKTVAKWDVTLNFPGVPVLAETALAVVNPTTGDLVSLSKDKGAVDSDVKFLPANDASIASLPRSETTDLFEFSPNSELVQVGSTLYAFAPPDSKKRPTIRWQVASDGPVTKLFDSRLAVIRSGHVALLRGNDAHELATISLPATSTVLNGAARPQAFGLGSGLAIAGNGVEIYE